MEQVKGKATDTITTEVQPSPEAAALIGQLSFAFDQFGMQMTMERLSPLKAMLGSVAHCIANDKIATQYKQVMTEVAMFLMVNLKVRERVAAKIGEDNTSNVGFVFETDANVTDQATQEVMPQSVPSPFCEVCKAHHPINTAPAVALTSSVITDSRSQSNILLQMHDSNSHESTGMHVVMSGQEAERLANSLTSYIAKIQPAKGH